MVKQLQLKLQLKVIMLLAVMTTAFVKTAVAEDYSKTYDYSELEGLLSGIKGWEGVTSSSTSYIKIPKESGNSVSFTIPIDNSKQPSSNITLTFKIATYGGGNNPSSSNTTITAVGTEASSNWSGSGVTNYPSSSSYVNGVMNITRTTSPTTLSGLNVTIGVNSGVKVFRLQEVIVAYTYGSTPMETVATPSFNPEGGTYNEAKNVSISTTTVGATIYYTTDGRNPTTHSTAYSSPIYVSKNTTIKAIAVKDGMNNSSVATADYSINVPYSGPGYVRINSLDDLTDGAKVIIAARYNATTSAYYAMTASTTGKPAGVAFTSTIGNRGEAVPQIILNEVDTYSWTVGVANNEANNEYTFTNSENKELGYTSGTDFAYGGDNTTWFISKKTSGNKAMVSGYDGFYIINKNSNLRGIALNNNHNFGAYGTGNNNNDEYNFYLDIFVEDADVPVVPSITTQDVDIAYNATQGSITFTVNNPIEGVTLSASTESNWLILGEVANSNVPFTCTANEEQTERTATVTLIYPYGNENVIEEVTVTQAKAPFSAYKPANSITSGKTYIIVNKESSKAMGAQNSNNRAAVDVILNNNEITVESSPTFCEFVITYLGKDGNNNKLYSIYDATPTTRGFLYAAGSSSNYLRTHTTLDNDSKWTIIFNDENGSASIVASKSSNNNVMQYNNINKLFSCYATASQKPIHLYEKVEPAITSVEITMNQFGVMTYAYDKPLDFSNVEGLTAYAATGINGSALTMTKVEQAAAAEGLMLEGTPNTTYTVPVSSTTPSEVSNNMLVGLTVAMPVDKVQNGNTTFILANGNDGVNWYKLEETYTLKANSAYLRLTADQVSQLGQETRGLTMVYGSDSNGIENVSREATTYLYFDLSGRRVENPTKGLYIVNGKKVNVK